MTEHRSIELLPKNVAHKTVVERYFDRFRQPDHRQILACLAEDALPAGPGALLANLVVVHD